MKARFTIYRKFRGFDLKDTYEFPCDRKQEIIDLLLDSSKGWVFIQWGEQGVSFDRRKITMFTYEELAIAPDSKVTVTSSSIFFPNNQVAP